MKKIYTLIALATIAYSANAQNKGLEPGVHHSNTPLVKHVSPVSGSRASGDTLLYIPLPGYTINGTDAAAFGVVNEDIDGLPRHNATAPGNFGLYYSTDSSIYGQSCATCSTPHGANFYHPWETPAPAGTDSAFFWSATSWFASPAQADNWLELGPITVPVGGATIAWYDRYNRYRDGYSVLIADGSPYDATSSPMDFTAFDISTNVFTQTDSPYPSATYATDTTWVLRSVVVPASFNGTQIIFAFHHTANDMDVLRIDEVTVVDGSLALGIADKTNGVKINQNSPNPFSTKSTISYELDKDANVVLSVFDVTGKMIAEQSAGNQAAGVHSMEFNAENLSAGVYYYSIKAGENKTSTVKMVVIK